MADTDETPKQPLEPIDEVSDAVEYFADVDRAQMAPPMPTYDRYSSEATGDAVTATAAESRTEAR